MNSIQTWAQGKYIDHRKYSHMPKEWKEQNRENELLLVRPSEEGNAICKCNEPFNAKWIASRLNLASELEQLSYDFATGKSDGTEIIEFVRQKLE